jgi:hypothetical protein
LENPGEELVSQFSVVPERTISCSWRHAHMGWHVVYSILVLLLAWGIATLLLVVIADVYD